MTHAAQMVNDAGRAAFWLLQFDHSIQIIGLVASIVGVLCTIYAIHDVIKAMQALDGLAKLVGQSQLVGQGAILFCQVGFLVINTLVISLPPVPMAMYATSEAGPWVVFVILTRKMIRLSLILVLTLATLHRLWTFHRVIAILASDSLHHHRRATDRKASPSELDTPPPSV